MFRTLLYLLFITTVVSIGFGQRPATTSVWGRVKDPQGAVVVGATVTLASAKGGQDLVRTNDQGVYVFSSVARGSYKLQATADGFAVAHRELSVSSGRPQNLDINLSITEAAAEVTIEAEPEVTTEADNNVSANILTGRELDALPDDPDELEAALRALAGSGDGEILLDGFSGGRLPPKEQIKEIRINSNPFSAGNRRGGRGRIEIITKPGTDDFRGSVAFTFNDESLNARNPSALNRPAVQQRNFQANVSGPLIKNKASFFFDINQATTDDSDLINAIILDSSLRPSPFNVSVASPSKRFSFSPRVNYELNEKHSLTGRYSFNRISAENSGIGGFSLPSRAFQMSNTSHTIQLTETAVVGKAAVSETRFQVAINSSRQQGNESPAISVLDAFNGGGSSIGLSADESKRFELNNKTTFVVGKHSLTVGLGFNYDSFENTSRNNFGGSFVFSGGLGQQLDANDQVVLDGDGHPIIVPVNSLEQYRRSIRFRQLGYTGAEIRELGGGPRQLTIAGGTPTLNFTQWEVAPYLQDDWRINPSLTFNFGLRFERHPIIESPLKVAPRFGFAWSPKFLQRGKGRRAVIRGGVGVFYTGIGESLAMQSLRYNGLTQQQYLITDPAVLDQAVFTLDGVTNVPTVSELSAFQLPQTTRQLSSNIDSPRVVESSIGIERQIPLGFVLATTYTNTYTTNALFSRNINAPLPGTFVPGDPSSGTRPFGDLRNIFEYDTSGRAVRNELEVALRSRFSKQFHFFANYTLGFAKSDTDGQPPVNQYDLAGEWGRSSQDVRHRVTVGGEFKLPWGIRLNPFINASSGRPFNITTGRDTNGDTLFNERPAFADSQTLAGDLRETSFGSFDVNPKAGQRIVPRNFGRGPASFSADLRVSKDFHFGPDRSAQSKKRGYDLTLGLQAKNIFNHPNAGVPISNMSSPLFGKTISAYGSRRIDLNVKFSF